MSRLTDLTIEDYERLDPHADVAIGDTNFSFSTPTRTALWRVNTILDKEPVTIEWIKGFSSGEVFVDIGANIGMYSLLAAKISDVRVFAFEPEAQNFAVLTKNILRNELSDKIIGWPVAISDEQRFGSLYLSALKAAESCHTFGEPVNHNLEPQAFPYVQGAVSTTLDALVDGGAVPVPRHVKIDVDGIEHRVISGATETLKNRRVSSLLVEVNPFLEQHQEMVQRLKEYGFKFDPRQVESAKRTEGKFSGLAEYLFRR